MELFSLAVVSTAVAVISESSWCFRQGAVCVLHIYVLPARPKEQQRLWKSGFDTEAGKMYSTFVAVRVLYCVRL